MQQWQTILIKQRQDHVVEMTELMEGMYLFFQNFEFQIIVTIGALVFAV